MEGTSVSFGLIKPEYSWLWNVLQSSHVDWDTASLRITRSSYQLEGVKSGELSSGLRSGTEFKSQVCSNRDVYQSLP